MRTTTLVIIMFMLIAYGLFLTIKFLVKIADAVGFSREETFIMCGITIVLTIINASLKRD